MNESLNCRSVVKRSAALPILGTFAVDAIWEKARAAVGKKPAGNIYSRLGVRPFINARGIKIPDDGNRYPMFTVVWDERAWNFSVADCDRELRNGEPRIEVLTDSNPSLVPALKEGDPKASREKNKLQIVSMTMQPGEEMIVGRRLWRILTNAHAKRKV